MRSLLVLIDGLGDEPIKEFNGKTPFAEAAHKNMDSLLANGCYAEVSICEDDIIPESCSCILRLLGVAREDMPLSRSYLELLAHNRDITEYEMVLRCNLVAVNSDGIMTGFNGQGLTPSEMAAAADVCDHILDEIEFIHLSEYRNLIILNKEQNVLTCNVPPPHENVGENVEALLAELKSRSLSMKYFLETAAERLQPFAKDGIRYMLYPWGSADRHTLPSFAKLHQISGGAVCKAEIVQGIAKSLGMELTVPNSSTGDIDTDVQEKALAAQKLLQNNDFVIAHFNGSDEASHRYDAVGKKAFIEKIDADFLGYMMQNITEPVKIVVCGDHVTSSVSGKHGRGNVPVIAGRINTAPKNIKITNYQDIINFLMRESD